MAKTQNTPETTSEVESYQEEFQIIKKIGYLKLAEGESVTGFLHYNVTNPNKDCKETEKVGYGIETPEAILFSNSAELYKQLTDNDVKSGSKIRVTFKGKIQTSAGKPLNTFLLEVARKPS